MSSFTNEHWKYLFLYGISLFATGINMYTAILYANAGYLISFEAILAGVCLKFTVDNAKKYFSIDKEKTNKKER